MLGMIKIGIFVALLVAVGWFSYQSGQDSIRADMAEAVKVATDKARKEEQTKQDEVNEIAQQQQDNLQNINDQLVADLSKLHNRSNKRHLPKDNKATCKGATGKNLSSPDAGFLVREAARADQLRTALKSCYEYADTVSKPVK